MCMPLSLLMLTPRVTPNSCSSPSLLGGDILLHFREVLASEECHGITASGKQVGGQSTCLASRSPTRSARMTVEKDEQLSTKFQVSRIKFHQFFTDPLPVSAGNGFFLFTYHTPTPTYTSISAYPLHAGTVSEARGSAAKARVMNIIMRRMRMSGSAVTSARAGLTNASTAVAVPSAMASGTSGSTSGLTRSATVLTAPIWSARYGSTAAYAAVLVARISRKNFHLIRENFFEIGSVKRMIPSVASTDRIKPGSCVRMSGFHSVMAAAVIVSARRAVYGLPVARARGAMSAMAPARSAAGAAPAISTKRTTNVPLPVIRAKKGARASARRAPSATSIML